MKEKAWLVAPPGPTGLRLADDPDIPPTRASCPRGMKSIHEYGSSADVRRGRPLPIRIGVERTN